MTCVRYFFSSVGAGQSRRAACSSERIRIGLGAAHAVLKLPNALAQTAHQLGKLSASK